LGKRVFLAVGINKYNISGNDLQGCVNDALNIATVLRGRGYEGITLLDAEAYRESIVGCLNSAISHLKYGDTLFYWHSSHGSYVPDRDGDEADGKDEVLCCYDIGDRGYILDDELYAMFQRRTWGSKIIVGTDTCFSGGISRFADLQNVDVLTRQKFLNPGEFLEGTELEQARRVEGYRKADKPRPSVITITGCAEDEVSYDAHIDGSYQGAMTNAAIQTFQASEHGNQVKGLRVIDLYRGIRHILPSDKYPQEPQLYAKAYQRYTYI
jgi:hypothetical protein